LLRTSSSRSRLVAVGLAGDVSMDHLQRIAALKRQFAGEQLVQDDAQE
jgi:hypothetical protein